MADGDVFRKAVLAEKCALTSAVSVFTFTADALPAGLPGQYTSIGVKLDDGARQLRQYSLVTAEPGRWEVAIERDGEVSTFLHERVAIGDEVDITLPAGDLVLVEGDGPVVLISQGIGSTPMVGMMNALQGSGRKVIALHADESEATYAQREQSMQLADVHVEKFRVAGERLEVAEFITTDVDVYLCGGTGFLQNVRDQIAALDVQPRSLHFELFSPNDWLVS